VRRLLAGEGSAQQVRFKCASFALERRWPGSIGSPWALSAQALQQESSAMPCFHS